MFCWQDKTKKRQHRYQRKRKGKVICVDIRLNNNNGYSKKWLINIITLEYRGPAYEYHTGLGVISIPVWYGIYRVMGAIQVSSSPSVPGPEVRSPGAN